jgi:hypothetical protein
MKGRHALWTSPLLAPLGLERPLHEMVEPLRVLLGGEELELAPSALIGCRTLLVGAAGSGKTTWLRLAFRGLLALDALPLVLDLRDLARARRPGLDAWIQQELARQVPEAEGQPGALQALSSDRQAPPVVLLLDGWDELGEAGHELREQLVGLAATYPRLGVVVASRPAARGLPRGEDEFRVAQLQPLDSGQLQGLIRRLLRVCVAEDQQQAVLQRFLDALDRSPEARSLARRPLLLQLMLLLSPEDPLPQRRHALYRGCVRALLESRPAGGGLGDFDERLAALSAFAARLQARPGASLLELSRALPADWPVQRRQAFLDWLAGPAGLLERRGLQLHFLHPSLREYLAALHLHRTVAPARAGERMLELAARPEAWETLRLWAAMLEPEHSGVLRDLIDRLITRDDDALLLAGCLAADGLATPPQDQALAEAIADLLERGWPPRIGALAQALASASSPHAAIARALGDRAEALEWPAWLRFQELALDADLGLELAVPAGLTGRVLQVIGGDHDGAEAIALGRMFSGGSPLWPGTWWQVSLLQVWPSPRVAVSRWVQRLATLGVPRGELTRLAAPRPRHSGEWEAWLRQEWTGFLDDHGTHAPAERWAHRLALSDPLSPDPLGSESAVRLLADTRTPEAKGGSVALLRAAARRALGHRSRLKTLLDRRHAEPLWPALARAVAGQASEGDRALLCSLARDPSQREGALRWGLQFLVRGDVLLPDGSVVTLEELGLELPLLS